MKKTQADGFRKEVIRAKDTMMIIAANQEATG
jgi:hypothetical protein